MYLDLEKRKKKDGSYDRSIWSLKRVQRNWDKYIATQGRLKKAYEKDLIHAHGWQIKDIVETLYYMQHAILKGGKVGCECIKEPTGNLDTGRHYYDIVVRYITKEKKIAERFVNFPEAMGREIGYWNKTWSGGFAFGSGAIGMSRKLDATNWYANICKEVIGIYFQLD